MMKAFLCCDACKRAAFLNYVYEDTQEAERLLPPIGWAQTKEGLHFCSKACEASYRWNNDIRSKDD